MISDIQSRVAPRYLNADELDAGLAEILRSPKTSGTVEMIVARPGTDQRQCPEQARLSPEDGLEGDRWKATCRRRLEDGSPDPEVQITLINSRCIQLLAGDRAHWALAGDNLFVDLDLSIGNLPPGTRLQAGSALLEICSLPHNGCEKFQKRFGKEALLFVNSSQGKALRLRGAHARVVRAGVITVGDRIERIDAKV